MSVPCTGMYYALSDNNLIYTTAAVYLYRDDQQTWKLGVMWRNNLVGSIISVNTYVSASTCTLETPRTLCVYLWCHAVLMEPL